MSGLYRREVKHGAEVWGEGDVTPVFDNSDLVSAYYKSVPDRT